MDKHGIIMLKGKTILRYSILVGLAVMWILSIAKIINPECWGFVLLAAVSIVLFRWVLIEGRKSEGADGDERVDKEEETPLQWT